MSDTSSQGKCGASGGETADAQSKETASPESGERAFCVREAVLADGEAILAILRQVGWFEHMESWPGEKVLNRLQTHLAHAISGEDHTVWVAEGDGGEVLGYLSVHWLPYLFLAGLEGYLSELFVRSDCRGQGVGKGLLEAVQREALKRGAVRLQLVNGKEWESFKRGFYRKSGWTERTGTANFMRWLENE
ncbi:MAG: GNAT family N-acetyltransferase [Magnetococcales bacterium]|nr:GNAT family N-acetyltransferase [Magnetococcales bacterium]